MGQDSPTRASRANFTSAAHANPQIAGYDELRELRRGGQGVVYVGVQRSTGQRVAIKVLLDGAWSGPASRRRFEREIDLIVSLRHPNIVRVFDSGVTADGHPFFVMEFIDGVSLDELLAEGERQSSLADLPTVQAGQGSSGLSARTDRAQRASAAPAGLPVRAALEMFVRICEAVNAAHQRGVIHRDLKPSNIRMDRDGTPHVLDFGLAKSAWADKDDPLSQTGDFMGSAPWASPEQADGNTSQVDVRSDVYSLGVMLFQLLTGAFPYPVHGGLRETLNNILTVEPVRPSALRRELDDEIDTIVLKCLAKPVARRYQSAGEVAREIRRYLAGEPIEAKRDSAWYQVRKKLHRYRNATRVAGAFVLLSIGAAGVMSVLWQRATRAERLAQERLVGVEAARSAEADARRVAEDYSGRLERINDFLTRMLASPSDLGNQARVSDVLDAAVGALDRGEIHDRATEVSLRDTIGVTYAQLGLYPAAETQLTRAVERSVPDLGDAHPYTLRAQSDLAWLRRLQGRLPEAERSYRALLATAERRFGRDHAFATQAMNDLALVLEMRGELEEAERLLRAVLDERLKQGAASPDAVTALGNLAGVLHSRGALAEAEPLMRQRLAVATQVFGPQHAHTVTAMNNLSLLLSDLGQLEEAVELARGVLALRMERGGENHPDALLAKSNLGSLLMNAAAFGEARALLEDAGRRFREVLGPDHVHTLTALGNLASVLRSLDQKAQSEALFREVVASRTRVLGPDHPDTLLTLNNLATLLQEAERYQEAMTLFQDLTPRVIRVYGESHPAALTARLNLAGALREAGEPAKGLELARSVAGRRAEIFGADHQVTLHARWEVARAEMDLGHADEAIRQMSEIVEVARGSALGPHAWYTRMLEGYLGWCHFQQGRYDQAEPLLRETHATLQKVFGDKHRHTRTAARRLAELYGAMGRTEEAERYTALLNES